MHLKVAKYSARVAMGNEIFRKEILPFAAMVSVVCMEMATTTIAKAAMNAGLSSLIYIVYYHSLGVFFLLPGFIIQRHRTHSLPLTLSILRRCFILGLLGTCLVMILGFQGLKYSSPTLGAGISNLMPGFTFVLAMIFRMEKFEVKKTRWQAKLVGTFVSIIGASVMTLYEGPTILGTSDLPQQSLLSYSSNWVLGGVMILSAYLFCIWMEHFAVLNLQTTTLKDYPEQITVVFFSIFFGSIQCAIFSLLMERSLDVWKLKPGIEMIAIVVSAVLGPLGSQNVTAFCLDTKGPLYVAMFKPLGVVIATTLNLVFLADALYLGSIIGSVITIVGFYMVMWGMSRETTMLDSEDIILCESGAVNGTTPLL